MFYLLVHLYKYRGESFASQLALFCTKTYSLVQPHSGTVAWKGYYTSYEILSRMTELLEHDCTYADFFQSSGWTAVDYSPTGPVPTPDATTLPLS